MEKSWDNLMMFHSDNNAEDFGMFTIWDLNNGKKWRFSDSKIFVYSLKSSMMTSDFPSFNHPLWEKPVYGNHYVWVNYNISLT